MSRPGTVEASPPLLVPDRIVPAELARIGKTSCSRGGTAAATTAARTLTQVPVRAGGRALPGELVLQQRQSRVQGGQGLRIVDAGQGHGRNHQ